MRRFVIGVDVGGTNSKLGIIDASGKLIDRSNLPTKSYIHNKSKLIAAIAGSIRKLLVTNNLRAKDIAGICIGLPGLIDPPKGIVRFLPNIPGWKNVPLRSILQKELRIPVFLENDVNLIALGEWKFGAGKGFQNIVFMTLGTGVGAGLILNNELYRGQGYVAGELGHVPLNEEGPSCNCGGVACLERTVGNRYLQEKAAKIFKDRNITLEEVSRRAKKGDIRAVRFWEETAVHIGNGLTGLVNLLNPVRVVIGGGVANSPKFLFKVIEKTIKRRAMKVQGAMVKVVKAKLGNDAGIIGAQVFVQEMLERSA